MLSFGDQRYFVIKAVGEVGERGSDCISRRRLCGISLGRVRANKIVLKSPDDANSVSAKAVTANGTVWPLNAEKRAAEMGSTCCLFSKYQLRCAVNLQL